MFFDGIAFDLYSVFEGIVGDHTTDHIFNTYEFAGHQVRPDGFSKVGLFLVHEFGRSLSRYESALATPTESGNEGRIETVSIDTTHSCNARRFMVRLWRAQTVLQPTEGGDVTQADTVTFRTVQRDGSGNILCESNPIAFPAHKASVWIDAGLTEDLPESDISLLVERPSVKMLIKMNFKFEPRTNPDGSAAFPGVLCMDVPTQRKVIAGSDDERQLRHYLNAYIAGVNVRDLPRLSPSTSPAPSQVQVSSPAASNMPISSQMQTIPSVASRGPATPVPSSSQHSHASSSAPTSATQAQQQQLAVQTDADASMSSTRSEPTGEQTSESRQQGWTNAAWSRLTQIAAQMSSRRGSPAPSTASSVAPTWSQITTIPREVSTAIMFGQDGDQRDQEMQDVGERSPAPSATSLRSDPELLTLLKEIDGVLEDAASESAMRNDQWLDTAGDSARIDANIQADAVRNDSSNIEAAPSTSDSQTAATVGTTRIVGVSYGDCSSEETPNALPVGPALNTQPLLLPTGSGSQVNLQANVVDAIENDVQMTDSQNIASDVAEPASAPQAATDVQNQVTQGTQAPTQSTQASASSDDDMQIISCTRAVQAGVAEAQNETVDDSVDKENNPPALSSSASDVPLAEARSTHHPQLDDDARSNAGTMVLARRARSIAAPSVAGSIALSRRDRSSEMRPSPSPSTLSLMMLNPGEERWREVSDYLTTLVVKDKSINDRQSLELDQERAEQTAEFEAAKRQYQEKIVANNLKTQIVTKQRELKRDTLRMLRHHFKCQMQVDSARFTLAKTGVPSRMGSDRRSRSRSIRARSPTPALTARRMGSRAGSRMGAPSVVPPSLIKRERIDLTGDDFEEVTRSHAGSTAARAGMRASSVSRSLGQHLGVGAFARGETPVKIGNVADLMRPPPTVPKRSPSEMGDDVASTQVGPARSQAGTSATSRRPRGKAPSHPGAKIVRDWLYGETHPRTLNRTGTPARSAASPIAAPIVINIDEPQRSQRARSVASQISHASSRRKQRSQEAASRNRQASATPAPSNRSIPVIPIEDNEDDQEREADGDRPLFLGASASTRDMRTRCSTVDTDYTTLFDEPR